MKYTAETFIKKAKEIHGDKYDYSKMIWNGSKIKITIICPTHGEFLALPTTYLQGVGCAECSFDRKKTTNGEYIQKCKEFHGNKYDYSKTEYTGWGKNVIVTCPEHGDFKIRASDHHFRGCQKCGRKNVGRYERKIKIKKIIINKPTYTKENFLSDTIKIHGDKYDYSLVEYKNKTSKVKIICKDHGIFEQSPSGAINGRGCPKCRNKKSQEQFIEECNKKHNNEYDYSLVKYINTKNKITIICKKHDEFEQIADHHLRGSKCPKCRGFFKNTESFILDSINIHGDKYDYSLVEYKKNITPVIIICNEHGIFKQIPKHHLTSSGCPECRNSRGENEIIQILKKFNIEYIRQKTFEGCGINKKFTIRFLSTKI